MTKRSRAVTARVATARVALALSLLASVSLGGCSSAPSGEGLSLAAGDIEDDIQLGKSQHPQILQQYNGAYDDPALRAYVDRIGQRLAAVSELSDIPFTFTLLDSDVVNAFALPGGYVYISRGLLALAQDEAEVAGVIGHEIGHVTSRHGAARQTAGMIGGLLGVLATVGGAVLGGEAGAQLGGQLGNLAVAGGVGQYSQSQEFQADKLGVRYLARAGYDTEAMGDFLQALQSNAELQAKLTGTSVSSGGIDHFFASHPYTPDRVTRARERSEERGAAGEERDRERFMRAIDGMIFGESPAQGYVMGRTFAHPLLRFRFSVPEGFKLRNTSSAVFADGDDMLLIFDMARNEAGLPLTRYKADKWADMSKTKDLDTVTTRGGARAAIGHGTVKLKSGSAEAGFAVIEGDGDTVYRFVLLTKNYGGREAAALRDVVAGFSRLSEAEAAKLEPLRIDIVEVRPGDTIDGLSARMQVDRLPREQFETLNGLDRGRTLEAGDLVKILVRRR
ncbi:MAG: M48 family metalloprotease [Geminicoccaceae bacterium]|nr:M48 family metalloprotease [Geminicoccaceae bacterium]